MSDGLIAVFKFLLNKNHEGFQAQVPLHCCVRTTTWRNVLLTPPPPPPPPPSPPPPLPEFAITPRRSLDRVYRAPNSRLKHTTTVDANHSNHSSTCRSGSFHGVALITSTKSHQNKNMFLTETTLRYMTSVNWSTRYYESQQISPATMVPPLGTHRSYIPNLRPSRSHSRGGRQSASPSPVRRYPQNTSWS